MRSFNSLSIPGSSHSVDLPAGKEHCETAVVMVVSEHPQPASGGPLGLCYKLLEALCNSASFAKTALYCLSAAEPKCLRISCVEDLQCFTQPASQSASILSRLRSSALALERGRCRAQRNGMQLLRAASEGKQIRRLRPLLDSLMASHRAVVFHAHTATVAYKIVRAFGHNADQRRWRLLITDHSKGGALSEYIELLGPSAIHDWNYRLVARQTKLAVETADVVAFPSQGARELWLERNPKFAEAILPKSAILYNGVARPKEVNRKSAEDSSVKLFAIAQHVPEKGLDRLIAAVAGLRGKLPGLRISLRIAGGFTRVTPELEFLCARLGLENDVVFLGRINHSAVLQEIAEACLFVAFPRVVVFDLALLEAMALGKPIVTNALRGNVEALGKTYPLFANDEKTFAEKIVWCSTDSALSHQTGYRNKRRYERLFTSDAMARRHCDLYSALNREILCQEAGSLVPGSSS